MELPARDVEAEYDRRMNALSAKERVARSAAMFQWTREMIGRQIVAEHGPMPPEELKWRVALRQYAREPAVTAMIEQVMRDVPERQSLLTEVLNERDELQ